MLGSLLRQIGAGIAPALALAGALALPALPAAAAESAEPDFAYRDQLIGGGQEPQADEGQNDDAGPQPDGMRSSVLELRSYSRSSPGTGNTSELGMFGQHRQETINWGDLFVEAAWRGATDLPGTLPGSGQASTRLTLRQIGMPVSATWSMSNTLGMLRTTSGDLFNSTFRFNLPSATLTGAGNYWSSPTTRIGLETGQFTQIEGLQGLGTRRLDGRATSVSLSERLGEHWQAGVHALSVDSRLDGGSYQALTAALAFSDPDAGLRGRLQMLTNGNGHHGEWLEGEWQRGFHSSRATLWNFTPQLYWYTSLLSSGQQGLALRHDFADPGLFWGLGLERTQNASFDALHAATDTTLLTANGGTRLDRWRSVGFNTTVRQVSPQFEDGLTSAYRYAALNLYGSRSAEDQADRLQVSIVDSSGAIHSRVQEITWTRDYTSAEDGTYGFTLGAARETNDNGAKLRPTAGLSMMRPFGQRGQFSTWIRYARDSDQYSTSYALSGTMQAQWQVQKNWSLQVSGSLNRLNYETQQPLFGSAPTRLQERALWVTVRWAESGGVPYLADQIRQGRGAGIVRGVVFQDENRDGVRQVSDRPAGGVVVWLDNMLSTTTGPDGRYEFPIVATGIHSLRIEASTVRLPWGTDEDKPKRVTVEARGLHQLDLPLIKIGE